MSDTVLFFAIEQQKVRIITAFLKSFERGLGRFKMACMWKVEERTEKSVFTEFTLKIS